MANVKMSIDRRFEFGKYKGLTFIEVLGKDLQYVVYLSSKINWLFNDSEKTTIRNAVHKNKNKDIHMVNVKSRTPFEEEMYKVFRQF